MNRAAVFILLASTVLAAAASGGTIHDIRTGLVPAGSEVSISGAVVTALFEQGVVVGEPSGGPYRSVWVWLGESPAVAVGDLVEILGTYVVDHDRDMISLVFPPDAHLTVVGTATPPVVEVTVADLLADPEAWESTRVHVTDGLIVQEVHEGGEWIVASYETGDLLTLFDYYHLFPDVHVAECYNNADGVFFYYGGQHLLKALAVEPVDCAVPAERLGFGHVKSLYH